MRFFVIDFSAALQAGIVIFGIRVDDNLFYSEIEIWPSSAQSSLYLVFFLSSHRVMHFSSPEPRAPGELIG